MKKAIIKGITIKYEDSESNKLDYITKIIINNYAFVFETLQFDRLEIDLSDFDQFFYDEIKRIYEQEEMKKILEHLSLPLLYIEYLLKKDGCDNNSFIEPTTVDAEIVHNLIAYKFYEANGNFDEFVQYLKDRKNEDKIIKWVKSETRFEIYNYILKFNIDLLKDNDNLFLDNINLIISNILQEISTYNMNKQSGQLPLLSLNNLDTLFCEFLSYINAPELWHELYADLKKNKNIIFEEQKEEENSSSCYIDEDGTIKMKIDTTGTIYDLCNLAHEFAHYIILSKQEVDFKKLSITEFPSIFFEQIMEEFLEKKGYSQSDIDGIKSKREQNNLEIYILLVPIISDINCFINNGKITKEDRMHFWKNKFSSFPRFQKEMKDLKDKNILYGAIENYVLMDCDVLNFNFIRNGKLIVEGYEYLLGTILVKKILEQRLNGVDVVSNMIDITNNFNNYNLQKVIETFNMEELFNSDNKGVVKQKSKATNTNSYNNK